MDEKMIDLVARSYANKMQLKSDYPHDWTTCYDSYRDALMDIFILRKQKHENQKNQ